MSQTIIYLKRGGGADTIKYLPFTISFSHGGYPLKKEKDFFKAYFEKESKTMFPFLRHIALAATLSATTLCINQYVCKNQTSIVSAKMYATKVSAKMFTL